MGNLRTARISTRLNSYTGYSVSCAGVWVVILAVAQRRLDRPTRKTLWLACSGWWSGWTSATIARVSYPPPKQLRPRTQKGLGIVSIALIAVGLINVIRLLATSKRPAKSATGA
jgi:hypothetical protein